MHSRLAATGCQAFIPSLAGNFTKNIGLVAEFSRFTKRDILDLSDLFNEPALGTISAIKVHDNFAIRLAQVDYHGSPFSPKSRTDVWGPATCEAAIT